MVPSTEAIADNQTSRLLIYPNPTSGVFSIECENAPLAGCSYCIYDALGKLVISNHLTSETRTIDLSAQPDGIYFLHLMEAGKVVGWQKIVKGRGDY
ncbi:MAG: T9SS type A sorting domain-containing protein [Bacteroidales bacterium]|nr:T9SS type A sorting domain-containing protein [Bacteroidales bacterium]